MSGTFDTGESGFLDWLFGAGNAGAEPSAGDTPDAPSDPGLSPLEKGAVIGAVGAGAKAGAEAATATGSQPPVKPVGVPRVSGAGMPQSGGKPGPYAIPQPGTPSGTPYDPSSAAGPYAQGKAPSATPGVGMGKPGPASIFDRAAGAVKRGYGAVDKFTGEHPLLTKTVVGGATSLAAQALAGGSSPSGAPRPPSGYDAGNAAAQAAERERKRRAGEGRASSVLTSPLGISKPASVGAKVLLGA